MIAHPPFHSLPETNITMHAAGQPSESNCYADIDSVYQYLTKERKIPPEHIVLYGRSLGSGPSIYLSSNNPSIAGLILHAPFTSVYRVLLPDCFGCSALGDLFPNITRMENVECPVFIAHGEEDRIVPFEHGLKLLGAVPRKDKAEFFTAPGLQHNYYETAEVEFALMEALNNYLDYHILARRLWMR